MAGKFAVLEIEACKYNYISSIRKMNIYVFINQDFIKQK